MRYFVDTGFWIALNIASDQHHPAAVACWSQLVPQRPRLVTTTWVFAETVTALRSRGRHDKAVEIGSTILNSPNIELVAVDAELFSKAWDLFCTRDDQNYSLADCCSFIVMQEMNLRDALGFDRHFRHFGFHLPARPHS